MVAVSADIEDMFMQVKVPMSDRGALRFLWWKEDEIGSEVIEYQMTAHPIGATSSPFCANFPFRRTASEWGCHYNESVAAAVHHNFYVDDLLISLPTVEEATQFVAQIREMLSKGGFKLCEWVNSHEGVYSAIPFTEVTGSVKPLAEASGSVNRTLGIAWDSREDAFLYQFAIPDRPKTRRGILSAVSSIYDPLGFIAPLIMPAKLLLQMMCRDKAHWDDPITSAYEKIWSAWLSEMKALNVLKIPRCIRRFTGPEEWPQLHIFCDASENGYGAVAYARFRTENIAYCSMLYAKSRIAPLKAVSIPRLELSAAVLATKLYEDVTERAQLVFEKVLFWTESSTVLYYINDESKRFSTFVANRLTIIHELSTPSQWKHVKSGCNPADPLSRGTTSLVSLKNWFLGPDFLLSENDDWPEFCLSCEPEDAELKHSTVQVYATSKETPLSTLIQGYSDWVKLLRTGVWLSRFKQYQNARRCGTSGVLQHARLITLKELHRAVYDVIRIAQLEFYRAELTRLEKIAGDSASPKGEILRGPLARLHPIMRDGLHCLGGRLAYSEYEASFKFPIILPPKHTVTDLLIRFYHLLEGHAGVSQVLASLRRKYWIVRGMAAVKRLIGTCWTCKKRLTTAGQQLMAPLPLARVERGWHPFKFVGVDYFGPFIVKHGRRQEKRYGCLFTCMQARAVHIELSPTLSTDSFIMALKRFVARRGTPAEIFSDNGGNFVGAATELRTAMKSWSQAKINDKLLSIGVQWHYNPPMASHRGGIWERIIRSVRRILLSVAGQQTLDDETLNTLLIEAERIVNSRPLVPLTSDPNDREALTPNDLLILRSNATHILTALPEEYNRCWRQVNYLTALFWKRWVREYLPLLQSRQKWLHSSRNFRPGDVVLVSSEASSRGTWPLGVIESCTDSGDGLVRTAVVRTKEGLYKRDVRKLCLLEGSDTGGNVVPAVGSPQVGGGSSDLLLQGGPL
ncbi:unnamed protein product [Dicrocoelium dendriticum]|nr:unnamed protein product [Dicrocoelium dendriticum]